MNSPDPAYFDLKAREIFSELIGEYKYSFKEVTIKPFIVTQVYINLHNKRKIEISNATFGSDYGFSFSLYKLGTDEYNILYNVPHERQDKDCRFLLDAQKDLFTTKDTLELISGDIWKQFRHIIFQK